MAEGVLALGAGHGSGRLQSELDVIPAKAGMTRWVGMLYRAFFFVGNACA